MKYRYHYHLEGEEHIRRSFESNKETFIYAARVDCIFGLSDNLVFDKRDIISAHEVTVKVQKCWVKETGMWFPRWNIEGTNIVYIETDHTELPDGRMKLRPRSTIMHEDPTKRLQMTLNTEVGNLYIMISERIVASITKEGELRICNNEKQLLDKWNASGGSIGKEDRVQFLGKNVSISSKGVLGSDVCGGCIYDFAKMSPCSGCEWDKIVRYEKRKTPVVF